MKKLIFGLSAVMIFTLGSCNKATEQIKPEATQTAAKTLPRGPYVFVSWNVPCALTGGNCLEEVVVHAPRPKLNYAIKVIEQGNGDEIRAVFSEYKEELRAYFPLDLIEGVIDGTYTVTYLNRPAIKTEWFTFYQSGEPVVYAPVISK